MHWRHKLGFTDGGGSPAMNEYASLSHTTRPSADLTTQGVSAAMNPRSASAKSVVSSNGEITAVGGVSFHTRHSHPFRRVGRDPRDRPAKSLFYSDEWC